MNMNKPLWQKDNKAESVREYAEWLNDNARAMFLNDHAHMEIVFALTDEGGATTIPVPVDQNRESVMQSVVSQVKAGNLYAVLHIRQCMFTLPTRLQPNPVEAVLVTAQTRDGDCFKLVNEIVETDTELKLEPALALACSSHDLEFNFFPK